MKLTGTRLREIANESEKIVRSAGQYVLKHWHKIKIISFKNRRDVVSNVDIEAENMLRGKLHHLFPDAGFIVEEGKNDVRSGYNWVIDPIDGTKQYVGNLPLFYTQIALIYNGEPVIGQIYNPAADQFFTGVLNEGVYLNGVKLTDQTRTDPKESIIDIDFGGMDRDIDFKNAVFAKLTKSFFRVWVSGGRFSSYLATGAIDACIVIDTGTKFVDVAPRIILFREMGLKVEYVTVMDKKIMIAANKKLFDYVFRLLT